MSSPTTPTPGPDPRAAAAEAERRLDFTEAYRRFAEAAITTSSLGLDSSASSATVGASDDDLLLFQVVRSLERSEKWRFVAALWECIGDRLDAARVGSPRSWGLYDGMTIKTDLWQDPRADDKPAGYYRDTSADPEADIKRLAHRQALSYGHGAEEAAANQRFALATLLRRKTALAWVMSAWGDRPPSDADGQWTCTDLLDVSGGKWTEAARSYFRAALFEARASNDDEKGQTFEVYQVPTRPEAARWPALPSDPTHRFFFDSGDDIDRVARCWHEWEQKRSADFAATVSDPAAAEFVRWHHRRRAERGLCNNLGVLEDAARAASRDQRVKYLHTRKRQAHVASLAAAAKEQFYAAQLLAPPKAWPPKGEEATAVPDTFMANVWRARSRWLSARVYDWLTGAGTSVWRTLSTVTAIFVGLFAIVFLATGSLGHCSGGSRCTGHLHDYADSLRFTVGQALTVPPSDLGPSTTGGQWLAVADTLVAAFALGYTIWVITRNSS